MRWVRQLAGLAVLAAGLAGAPAASADPAALVNTLSGTLGPGFPTVSAALPFGMIQPGPDTTLANGSSGPGQLHGLRLSGP